MFILNLKWFSFKDGPQKFQSLIFLILANTDFELIWHTWTSLESHIFLFPHHKDLSPPLPFPQWLTGNGDVRDEMEGGKG
jgi:hypothetical protein